MTAIAATRFIDGRLTAGWHVRTIKPYLQVDPADERVAALRQSLAAAILSNELFEMAVRPRRLSPLPVSRYEAGMS